MLNIVQSRWMLIKDKERTIRQSENLTPTPTPSSIRNHKQHATASEQVAYRYVMFWLVSQGHEKGMGISKGKSRKKQQLIDESLPNSSWLKSEKQSGIKNGCDLRQSQCFLIMQPEYLRKILFIAFSSLNFQLC